MSVLASGAIDPREAIEYVRSQKKIESIVFGASSKSNILNTKRLIDEYIDEYSVASRRLRTTSHPAVSHSRRDDAVGVCVQLGQHLIACPGQSWPSMEVRRTSRCVEIRPAGAPLPGRFSAQVGRQEVVETGPAARRFPALGAVRCETIVILQRER